MEGFPNSFSSSDLVQTTSTRPPAVGGGGCSLGDTTPGLPSCSRQRGVHAAAPAGEQRRPPGSAVAASLANLSNQVFLELGRRAFAMRGHSCSPVGPQLSYLSQADASTSPTALGGPRITCTQKICSPSEPKGPSQSVQPVPAPTLPRGRGRSREAN